MNKNGNTINKLINLFEELEIKCAVNNDIFTLTSITTNYVDHVDGDKSIAIKVMVDQEHKNIHVYAPNCFDYVGSDHRAEAAQLLLWLNCKMDYPHFEVEYSDNEVWLGMSVGFEDDFIDATQLRKMISSIIRSLDDHYEVIQRTLTTGELPETLYEKRERLELADLVRAAGGVEGLRGILSERGLI